MAEEKDVEGLSNLPARCAAAPKFGKNAKALLLEALDGITDDFEFNEEKQCSPLTPQETISTSLKRKKTSLSTLPQHFDLTNYEELLEQIPGDERPFISYQNHLKVPRICRQTEIYKLTGKYLAFLLKRMDLSSRERCLREIRENEELRNAAVAASKQHEEEIYKTVYNKSMYLQKMQISCAEGAYISASTTAEDLDIINTLEVKTLEGEGACDFEIHGTARDKRLKQEDVTQTEIRTQEALSITQVQSSQHTQDEALQRSISSESKGDGEVKDKKTSQVLHFVKRILDPFFSAKFIDKELYKHIAKKVVAKILEAHEEDPNADFLIRESSHVTKIVEKYIKYFKKHGLKAS